MKGKIFKYIIMILFLLFLNAFVFGYIYKLEYKEINSGFYLNGEDEVTVEYGNKYNEEGYVALLNGKNYEKNVSIETNLDENKIGTYKDEVYSFRKVFGSYIESPTSIIELLNNINAIS